MSLDYYENTLRKTPDLYHETVDLKNPAISQSLEDRFKRMLKPISDYFSKCFFFWTGRNYPDEFIREKQAEVLMDAVTTITYYQSLSMEFCREIKRLQNIIKEYELGLRTPPGGGDKPHLKVVK